MCSTSFSRRHSLRNVASLCRVGLAVVVLVVVTASGCAELRSDVVEFVGGRSATWRGLDLVGPRAAEVLSDEEIEWRLAFLTDCLADRQLHAQGWQFGWLTVNAGGMVASSVLAAVEEGDDRVYNLVGAVKGGVGTTYMILGPIPAWRGAMPIQRMPNATRDEKIAQLRRAEQALREAAEHARRRKSWVVHAGNVALNLAGAAVLLTRDRADLAALSFGVDTLVGEIQIWSRPWSAEQDWDNYRSMVAAGRATGARRPASWSLVPSGRGISFVARF